MTIVLIDIDVDFDYMKKYDLFSVLEQKIDFCSKLYNVQVEYQNIMKSQSNHIHLFLRTKEELSPYQIVQFKFCVGEDHKRLNYSIRRYERIGQFLDFFWMTNVKKKHRKKRKR